MENNQQPNIFEEEKSSFDLVEWVFRILRYWYLLVIGLIVALSVALLQNRKWIPEYQSMGTLIIKDGGGAGGQLMSGFGVDAGYKNVNNQVIILSSYDLMCRVVDSLPFMSVDYITQGRFRTRNLYTTTPIIVEATRLSPSAYNILYMVEFRENGILNVSSTNEEIPFQVEAHYGQPISCDLFDATIWPTEYMVGQGKMYFRFRTRESLVADFSSRLGLSFVSEGSTVLQLALSSETPQRDCDFINKLCDIYLMDNLERKNNVADNSINFINQQLDLLQGSLTVSESAITQFRQKNKFVDVSAYAGTLMQKIANYDAQVMSLNLKETYLNYLTNYLENNMETGGVIAPSSLGLNESMLMTLVQQLNDLHIQRGQLSEKNVYYAKYTEDINNVKAAIKEVVSSMRASLEIEKTDLNTRYSQVEKDIKNLPKKELEMVEIERRYRIDDNYYTFFLQKKAETEIQKASNTPDNTVLDKARTILMTNADAKSKNMTRYLIMGLVIPLVIIILMELLNNKLRTPKEVERLSDFKLIGTVRHARSLNPTLVKESPRSSYAEMLRSIRTQIEFIVQRKSNIMLSITSTQSGDGKTFLATNVAALYAMTGKRTLLIDMDIRKPNIHTRLGVDNGMGVTNYLIDECTLDDIIIKNPSFEFDVILAGTVPPNPGELIRSDKLGEMLQYLRTKYDFIIIDSSPIGLVPDACALVEQTDITLFVIRHMMTNRFFCKNTLEQLSVNYSNKIKLIFSDIPTNHQRGGKSYSTKYGYNRGYYDVYGYGHYGYTYGYGSTDGNNNYYAEEEE